MISISETKGALRLACETCGAHTLQFYDDGEASDHGHWVMCDVCGTSSRPETRRLAHVS